MKSFVYTVTQLNNHAKSILENNIRNVWIKGEVSSFKRYSSGHAYFTLKDNKSEISCTIFNYNTSLKVDSGVKLTINGDVSIYSSKGIYQIIVKDTYIKGSGLLWNDLLLLKKKLNDEGIFDTKHKKELPFFINKIGIITSLDGSVLKDLINILERRSPYLKILVMNSIVQGKHAPKFIKNNINLFDTMDDIDALIIARGGGSNEDLMCFNDESLIRTIFSCKIPIVSAIGHGADLTLCDLVSDVKVSTPSEAAEIIAPSINELYQIVDNKLNDIHQIVETKIKEKYMLLDKKQINSVINHKFQIIKSHISNIFNINNQMKIITKNILDKKILYIENNKKILKKYNVDYLKKIGFSIVKKNKKIIFNKKDISINDQIIVDLYHGSVKAIIKEIYD